MDAVHFARLGDAGSREFGVGPTVTWNVFDAGRIGNNVKAADARQQQALAEYQRVVLASLREEQTAIAKYSTEQQRHQ